MQLKFRPESIVTDLSSFFDVNDLYITFKVSPKDAVSLKRMGFNVRDYGENNKVIRVKMVALDHSSRGFGIYINNKTSTPADLFYTKDLELDELIVIPRGPIPTYNGKTFFMPYLMTLEAHSVKKEGA